MKKIGLLGGIFIGAGVLLSTTNKN